DLIVEWRVEDPGWCEVFAGVTPGRLSRLLVLLDAQGRVARVHEEACAVEWDGVGPRVRPLSDDGRGQDPGPPRTDTLYNERGPNGILYPYRFTSGELKDPLAACISD